MRGPTLGQEGIALGRGRQNVQGEGLVEASMISGAMVPVARISMLFKSSSSPAGVGSGVRVSCALQSFQIGSSAL